MTLRMKFGQVTVLKVKRSKNPEIEEYQGLKVLVFNFQSSFEIVNYKNILCSEGYEASIMFNDSGI